MANWLLNKRFHQMDPMYSQKLVFEGISVDVNGDGSQYHLDATVGECIRLHPFDSETC